MGFPVGCPQDIFPKLLILTFSLLGLIRIIILSISNFMGLSEFLETQAHFQDNPAQIHSTSAARIRKLLPVIKLSAVGGGDPPESCAVCLSELVGEEEIRWLSNCKHIFHRSCLDRWMDHDQITCPLCRTPFAPRHLRLPNNASDYSVHGF
ncbi:hypothetical protein BUALT_Bualt01G0230800 [Buddleja alternifolia]|uniref:RING-type domain-containing protein n=1 Tax=Buddleja alternifolia TaxID=168488 RepID=A0AAV6YAI3_9LAMI|nr:hypothetical protein BUALT_Bualt01G0230800 [Buddleja alternifolia]